MSVTQVAGPYIKDNAIDGTKIAVTSDVRGDVLVYDGTNYVRLGADNGKFLRSNGTGSNPSWETAGGGGASAVQVNDNVAFAAGTGSDSKIYYDGTDTHWDLRDTGTGDLVIALAASHPSPDPGAVHIWEGNAGSVAASTDTQLIVEHSGNAGISILSPANSVGQLSFGSPTDNRQGGMSYNHDQNCLYLRAGQTDRMRVIGGTGQVFINETTNAGNGDATEEPMLTVKMKDSSSSGEIMGFKHVSHAQTITSYAEADSFFTIRRSGTQAQLGMWGVGGTTGGQIIANCKQPYTNKNTSATGVLRLTVTTGSGNGSGSATAALSAYNSEPNNNMVTIDDNTTTRFLFGADGTAHADESWTEFSDGRLKFNQEVVPYGLAEVMQLQPKIYNKDSGYIVDEEFTDAEGNVVSVGQIVLEGNLKRNIGFVAQEVKAIIPEIVKDVNDFSWYSLSDGKLMAVVVKAIQELKAEVDALRG